MIPLSIILTIEFVYRFVLGFGSLPLYVEHSSYEYILEPNQNTSRFGNVIITNKYSMRSKAVRKNSKKILKIGDSVINGGNHVSNEKLSSTVLERNLQKQQSDTIQVLNISAGSWGPDNAYAYINEHGHFDASMMILVFSSHDLNDNMHFRKVVGKHQSWPSEQPFSATTDLFSSYIFPKSKIVVRYQ